MENESFELGDKVTPKPGTVDIYDGQVGTIVRALNGSLSRTYGVAFTTATGFEDRLAFWPYELELVEAVTKEETK